MEKKLYPELDLYSEDSMQMIGTKEIAKLMNVSIVTAREIMHRKDFPSIKIGKNLKVMKSAFVQWAYGRR